MFDPFEYFVLRRRDGLPQDDFKTALGKVPTTYLSFARAEHGTEDPRDPAARTGDDAQHRGALLRSTTEPGVKSEYYENSMKIGGRYFRQMGDGRARLHQLDCRLRPAHRAGHRRKRGLRRILLSLLRKAYGI